jgi:hypothetical protein
MTGGLTVPGCRADARPAACAPVRLGGARTAPALGPEGCRKVPAECRTVPAGCKTAPARGPQGRKRVAGPRAGDARPGPALGSALLGLVGAKAPRQAAEQPAYPREELRTHQASRPATRPGSSWEPVAAQGPEPAARPGPGSKLRPRTETVAREVGLGPGPVGWCFWPRGRSRPASKSWAGRRPTLARQPVEWGAPLARQAVRERQAPACRQAWMGMSGPSGRALRRCRIDGPRVPRA